MNNQFEASLVEANNVAKSLLIDSNVESYGIINQNMFIDFRDGEGQDHRLHINSNINIVGYIKPDGLDVIEYSLLCMHKSNLLNVIQVECKEDLSLIIYFHNDIIMEIASEANDSEEDPWQLNSSLPVSEGGKSIIALAGNGFAVWS